MWELYGLERNPFEIKAVERDGLIPVSTFLGRVEDRNKLKDTIKTHNHSLSLIVGERGVGKTSLGNVVRADLFSDYFTTISEIDTQHTWTSIEFVQEALSNIYETTLLAPNYSNLGKNYLEVCKEIQKVLSPIFFDEQSNIGVQAGGIGLERGKGKYVGRATFSLMKTTFKQIILIIKQKGYKGLILQFNNLDNIEIEAKTLSSLFSDLRDFLINDNTHFIFLGNKLMEAGFKFNPKVNECIATDIQLNNMDAKTITKIISKRYETFKIQTRIPVPPVNEKAIELISKLFDGNIRQVFYSLDNAVQNASKGANIAKTLTDDEIRITLSKLASARLKENIHNRALEVLKLMIKKKRDVTNTEITKELHLISQNTSKYLKQLKDCNLVIPIDRIGRKIYYRPVHEAKWLMLDPTPGTQSGITQWGKN